MDWWMDWQKRDEKKEACEAVYQFFTDFFLILETGSVSGERPTDWIVERTNSISERNEACEARLSVPSRFPATDWLFVCFSLFSRFFLIRCCRLWFLHSSPSSILFFHYALYFSRSSLSSLLAGFSFFGVVAFGIWFLWIMLSHHLGKFRTRMLMDALRWISEGRKSMMKAKSKLDRHRGHRNMEEWWSCSCNFLLSLFLFICLSSLCLFARFLFSFVVLTSGCSSSLHRCNLSDGALQHHNERLSVECLDPSHLLRSSRAVLGSLCSRLCALHFRRYVIWHANSLSQIL